jgi:hypothetical protein
LYGRRWESIVVVSTVILRKLGVPTREAAIRLLAE